jgi:hypothetical protein
MARKVTVKGKGGLTGPHGKSGKGLGGTKQIRQIKKAPGGKGKAPGTGSSGY